MATVTNWMGALFGSMIILSIGILLMSTLLGGLGFRWTRNLVQRTPHTLEDLLAWKEGLDKAQVAIVDGWAEAHVTDPDGMLEIFTCGRLGLNRLLERQTEVGQRIEEMERENEDEAV